MKRKLERSTHVTSSTFEETFTLVEELFRNASFIALDEEMTGISLPSSVFILKDDLQTRYSKMKQVVQTFSIWQFGLSFFVQEGEQYKATPFTFWIIPKQLSKDNYDPLISFSASGLEFLRNTKVDLNQWLNESIYYVNKSTEEKLHKQLFETPAPPPVPTRREKRDPILKESELSVAEDILWEINEWINTESKEFEIEDTKFTEKGININMNIRKGLLGLIKKSYPDLITEMKRTAPYSTVWKSTILNLTPEEKIEREKVQEQDKIRIFHNSIGIRRIFTLLVNCKKPLIVHNGLYDLMFLINHLDVPLPDTYQEFNKIVRDYFPTVYDTKYIAARVLQATDPTSLEYLYELLQKDYPNQVVTDTDLSDEKVHVAGYDAYLTGSIFAFFKLRNINLDQYVNTSFLIKSVYFWHYKEGKDLIVSHDW